MARRTFGRDGSPITIREVTDADDAGLARKPVAFTEPIAGNADDDGNEPGDDTGSDSESGSGAGTDSADEQDSVRVIKQTVFIDPATIGQPAADTGTRTRKPRGPNKPKANAGDTKAVVKTLERVLLGMHKMGAALLSEPELNIDEDEAAALAAAVAQIAAAYNFEAVLSPKVNAVIELATVAAMVYGPKIAIIVKRQKRPMRNVTSINNAGQQ